MGKNQTIESKSQQVDSLHIEYDIICGASNYKRETVDTHIKANREIDAEDVVDILKDEIPKKFYTDGFKDKYSSYFSPGDEVDITLISWIRQPFIEEIDLE